MARLPRLTLPGYPHHIIQRGNNRQVVFMDDHDRRTFLNILEEYARREKVAVHAYVLMSNHVHLLVTPETATGVPQMMQSVGRRYVRYFNQRHGRTGTLWEGRYKSTLIQAERYLLACMVYLDLNPVRAHLVSQPEDHPWSSHAHYIGRHSDRLVTPHPLYWEMGNTPFAREAAYADLVRHGNTPAEVDVVRAATSGGWALGDAEHMDKLRKDTPRRLSPGKAGRPRRKPVPD
jgi:putative transposase